MNTFHILGCAGIIIILLFLYFAIMQYRLWLKLTAWSDKPYRQFFRVAVISSIICCLTFALSIAQENYMKNNLSPIVVIFVPIIILIITAIGFSYKRLSFLNDRNGIKKTIFVMLGLFTIAELLFDSVCLIFLLLLLFYGFGNMNFD
jgi:hypothetical protein